MGIPTPRPIAGVGERRWASQMLSRRGHWLARHATRPSFAGTGLLERMRSTTFALLGITAALGLGLVAIVSQQGWPLLPAAPLPGLSVEQSEIHEAIEAPPGIGSPAAGPSVAAVAGRASTDHRTEPRAPGSHVSGSRHLDTAPPSAPAAAAPADSEQSVPLEPAPTPVPVSPAPSSGPAPSSSPASSAPAAAAPTAPAATAVTAAANQGRGNAYGKSKVSAGSKGKAGSAAASASPAPAPAPQAVKPERPAATVAVPAPEAGASGSPGKGNGNAYGHSK